MASFQIAPPEQFNFEQPEEWPRWIRRFERFSDASGLSKKDEAHQVNTLIYCMGDAADDILTSLSLTTEEQKVYKTVRDKLEAHFVKKRNTIYERSKFNLRVQQEGESVDSFITDLHCLAQHCNYGLLRNEMIRDRIVVGLLDAGLSMKLQLDPDLTLEKATAAARQNESVKKQQDVVRAEQKPSNVEAMTFQKPRVGGNYQKYTRPSTSHPTTTTQTPPPRHPQNQMCTRCGKIPYHAKQFCPAIKAECKKCGKRGHYQIMCKTIPNVSELNTGCTSTSNESDDFFLLTVNNMLSKSSDAWTVDLTVNDIPIQFKIDTGADVTAIPPKEFSKLKGITLTQACKVLHGPAKHPLKVNGQFTGKLSYKQFTIHNEIFVIDGLQQPLMGRPAIEALNLLSRINIVSSSEKFVSLYPDLFRGLGTFGAEYHITLKQDAKPFTLSAPRRVALPLLPKVKAELARMEKLGVISKVDTPTEWCAGIVIVPKPNDDIRICVDLTKLNESVCREKHILPSVEQILAQLGNSTVFTKLDANAGFWQIKLSQESSPLTTFITPYGRF